MRSERKPTIDALMHEYLAAVPARRRRRKDGGVASSLQLLAHGLDGYGHQYLSRADSKRFFVEYEEDERQAAIRATSRQANEPDADLATPELSTGVFCRMFGIAALVAYLDEFLDDFLIRKVLMPVEMVEATIADIQGFVVWLADRGYLSERQARSSLGRTARAADEVPAAERLSHVLYEACGRNAAIADDVGDGEIIDDYLVVERVAPGRLWLIGVDGALKVPEAASRLARPGWTINLVIQREGDLWRLLEVGNVYPRTLA